MHTIARMARCLDNPALASALSPALSLKGEGAIRAD